MRTVYLKDHKEAVLDECLKRNSNHYFSKSLLIEALEANAKDELRYNKTYGITQNKSMGRIAEYVNKTDISEYDSDEEAAIWEFSGWVRNSASRKERGYSII